MTDTTEAIRIKLQFEADQAEKQGKRMERQLAALENRLDPLGRKTRKYNKDLRLLEQSFERGLIDAERYERTLADLDREFDRASGASGKFTSAERGRGSVLRANRNIMQQVGFQTQDFFVQIQGGTNFLTAFTQQGSQLLGFFGAYGAIAGAALAVTGPLLSVFRNSGEEAKTYAESVEELQGALEEYRKAAELAAQADLSEDFGAMGEELRGALQLLRDLARVEAVQALQQSVRAFGEEFDSTFGRLDKSERDMRNALRTIQEEFGLNREEAFQLKAAIDAIGQSNGPEQLADRSRDLRELFERVFGSVSAVPPELQQIARAAAQAQIEAVQLLDTMIGVERTTADATLQFSDMERSIRSATGAAAALARERARERSQAEAAAKISTDDRAAQLASYGAGRQSFDRAVSEERYRAPEEFRADSKSSKKDPKVDFGRQIIQLERQLELVGKSTQEVAQLETKWRLLDEAKRKGIPVTEGLTARIEEEAKEVGKLAEQYEKAKDKTQALEQINTTLKDTLLDTAMGGVDAFDRLKQAIKRAALEYALFGQGPIASISGGGFGGLLGGLFGGFRASGGPVKAGVPYIVNENTPNSEVFVPSQSGAILNVPQAQAALKGNGGKISLNVVSDPSVIVQIAENTTGAMIEQNNDAQARALPGQVNAISGRRDPRVR